MDSNMTILVVDDFNTVRRILKKSLTQLGFANIVEAENGEEALRKLKENKIEFIFADWNMPKMTGLELLKAIRDDAKFKDIPFIMVTAEARKPNIIAAIEAGANNYIVKPFTTEILKEKMEIVMFW